MAVAIEIREHLDRLIYDPLYREATTVDDRINVFDVEGANGDRFHDLGSFVHSDAIDMRMSSRFELRKRDGAIIYKAQRQALVPSGTDLRSKR
ncbi:MAG: hypothetical protein ABWY14_13505 [Tardiphaga sp.]